MDSLSTAVSCLDLQSPAGLLDPNRPVDSNSVTALPPPMSATSFANSPVIANAPMSTPSTASTTGLAGSADRLNALYSSPSSSAHTPPPVALSISADVQARIMAFQQKRMNNPVIDHDNNDPSRPNLVGTSLASAPDLSQLPSLSAGSSPQTPVPQSTPNTPGDVPSLRMGSLALRRGIRLNTPSLSDQPEAPNTDASFTNNTLLTQPFQSIPTISLNSINSTTSSISSSLSSRRKNLPGKLPSKTPQLASLPESKVPKFNTNLFNDYSRYIDIKTGTLNFTGKASLHSKGINFTSGTNFNISLDQLEPLGELGKGNYGTVTKVLHKPTNVIMAMKEIRLELEESKFTQIIMELDILHKCDSPYIVDFYGAFFVEGAVYVCMEYMDGGSLDKIYSGGVEEPYLAQITQSVVKALQDLKDNHNIIHRDVKPTNILVSSSGKVKMCDFGVSGNLVASIAKTNIGCQSYMAPERIQSVNPSDAITYTTQSDIWSLGLSILEVAMGCYPYPPETYDNIFSQLSAIVEGEPPSLPPGRFSQEAIEFVSDCLHKVPRMRPTYAKLLTHPWLKKWDGQVVDMATFVKQAIEKIELKKRATSESTD